MKNLNVCRPNAFTVSFGFQHAFLLADSFMVRALVLPSLNVPNPENLYFARLIL
jgi:hypothetical protein